MRRLVLLAVVLFFVSVETTVSAQSIRDRPFDEIPLSASAGRLSPDDALDDYIDYVRIEPFVIREGMDTFELQVYTRPQEISPGIVSLEITFGRHSEVMVDGAPLGTAGDGTDEPGRVETVTLYDDGTHGDDVPGDGIFIADQFSAERRYPDIPWDAHGLWARAFTLQFEDGTSYTYNPGGRFNLPAAIRIVDPATVPIPEIYNIGDTIQYSDHAVVLVSNQRRGSGWRSQHFGPEPNSETREIDALLSLFYEHFPDDRDFLIYDYLISAGLCYSSECLNRSIAAFGTVQQTLAGIGAPARDFSDRYGSAGRLKGIANIYTGYGSYNSYVLLHELTHYWAANIDLISFEPTLVDGLHWSRTVALGTSGFGQSLIRYDRFESEGGGVYRAYHAHSGFNPSPSAEELFDELSAQSQFNPLELYFMGLIPPEEVEPFQVLENAQRTNSGREYDEYTASALHTVTVNDLIAAYGPRLPAYPEAQRAFNATWVIPSDRPLTPTELSFFDFVSAAFSRSDNRYGASFEDATSSRATFSTQTAVPLLLAQEQAPSISTTTLSIYPNPAHTVSQLQLTARGGLPVRVRVYDVLGRLRTTLYEGILSPGSHALPITGLSAYANGMYFCVVEEGNRREAVPFLIQH